jgi:hypothetical protein
VYEKMKMSSFLDLTFDSGYRKYASLFQVVTTCTDNAAKIEDTTSSAVTIKVKWKIEWNEIPHGCTGYYFESACW